MKHWGDQRRSKCHWGHLVSIQRRLCVGVGCLRGGLGGWGDGGVRAHNSHTWSTNHQSLRGHKAGRLHLETNAHRTQDRQRRRRRNRNLSFCLRTGSLERFHLNLRQETGLWSSRWGNVGAEFHLAGTLNHTVGLSLLHWMCVFTVRSQREEGSELCRWQEVQLAVHHGKSLSLFGRRAQCLRSCTSWMS